MAFGSYLLVICGNLCPNAAPLQKVEDTFQTSFKGRFSNHIVRALKLNVKPAPTGGVTAIEMLHDLEFDRSKHQIGPSLDKDEG